MSDFGDVNEDVMGHVTDDTVTGLRSAFGGDASVFSTVGQFHTGLHGGDVGLIDNERCAVVVWEYQGVHSAEFLGIEATGTPVTIEGCTVVSLDQEGQLQYRRYVNWVGVLGQLGVTFTRPIQYDASQAG